MRLHRLAWLFPAVALFGCAHVRNDEMSSEQHLQEAEEHQRRADAARTKYPPAAEVRPSEWVRRPPPGEAQGVPQPLATAAYEQRCADEHRAAAASLQRFEDRECEGIGAAARGACPLVLGWVQRGVELKDGVRLELKPGVDTALLERRIGCHLAFAQRRDFQVPECPLYRKGVSLHHVSPTVLELRASSDQGAELLRQDLRTLFGVEAHTH